MKAMCHGKGKCVDFSSFEFVLETKSTGTIVINMLTIYGIVTVNIKFEQYASKREQNTTQKPIYVKNIRLLVKKENQRKTFAVT